MIIIDMQVLLNVGLCIALHDITKIEESYAFPRDGASHTTARFRFVVFRPFMEEILIGKIRSCSIDGVYGNSLNHFTFHFASHIVGICILLQSHQDSSKIQSYRLTSCNTHLVLTKWNKHGFGNIKLKMEKRTICLWMQVYSVTCVQKSSSKVTPD